MKKVGIITLCGNNNYGNKLQNIALENVIKKMGLCPETIWNDDVDNIQLKKKIKKNLIYLKQSIKLRTNVFLKVGKRKKTFIKYNKNINYSKYKLSEISNNKKLIEKYDFFIVGSDQVWNYNDPVFSKKYFLDFSPDKNKNIAYAASFGVDYIPKSYDYFYKNSIKNFKSISVREANAVNYLKKIGFRRVLNVLDPTLLLNSQEWEEYIEQPTNTKEAPYLLIYFLGEYDKTHISDYAKKNNLKVIDLLDIKNQYYISNPGNFLYYIKNAEIVFTDSFHCTVFSIIYKKEFFSFDKNQNKNNITNSRINSLLEMFSLMNRKYDESFEDKLKLPINYNKVDEILNLKQKDSYLFLRKSFNIKDSE